MISYGRKFGFKSQKKKLLKKTFSQVPRRKKYPQASFNFKFLRAFIFILFLAVFYFLFFHSYFKIKKIIVVDQKIISENKVEEIAKPILNKRRYLIFPGHNIFIFDEKLIEKYLLEQISEIESIEIVRKFPDILKIKVKEAKPVALWKSKDEYHYLDKEGVVRGKIDNIESLKEENIFTVTDLNNKDVHIKENVLYAKHLNFIKVLYERLPGIKINIKEVALPSPLAEEIYVKTDKDWRIFFVLDREIDQQLANLQLVLENEIIPKMPEKELDYIDLRVESWVYYKRRELSEKPEEKKSTVEGIQIAE